MTTDLGEQLGLLGLRYTAGALDDLIALATKSDRFVREGHGTVHGAPLGTGPEET